MSGKKLEVGNEHISTSSTTELVLIIGLIIGLTAILGGGITAWLFLRRRRSERLRAQFGSSEYDRAVKEDGSRRHAEAGLKERTARVESLNIRPLAPGDRARFVESWRRVEARFVDGPGGAVTEADQLLGDVMSTRGYPVSDFEQRAADISVDHPLVLRITGRPTKSRCVKQRGKPTQKICARQ